MGSVMENYPVGYTVLKTEDPRTRRSVMIDVWYPASQKSRETPCSYGLGRGRHAGHAPPADGLHPVIVISYGAFGAARNYSWIAEHLGRNGYLVAGVSHFRESQVYGPETIDPDSVLQPWIRPPDCSAALDHILGSSEFATICDPLRIGALGHSSGGATIIALGGAVFDPGAMHQYCVVDASGSDRGCGYAKNGTTVQAGDPATSRQFRDKRIRAIVALDPALGPGYNAASLAAVTIPPAL
jgi:predicted dienelactone hydrolase